MIVVLQGCVIVMLRARLHDCCVIVPLQGCMIVVLQGCVIVMLQGCMMFVCLFVSLFTRGPQGPRYS
jgi:hypothetical protein